MSTSKHFPCQLFVVCGQGQTEPTLDSITREGFAYEPSLFKHKNRLKGKTNTLRGSLPSIKCCALRKTGGRSVYETFVI